MKIVSTNPSRNFEILGEVESSSKQEVIAAVSKAKKAFLSWSNMSIAQRIKRIKTFIDLSKKEAEEIAQLIAKETGRPIKSARANVAGGFIYFEAYMDMAKKYLSPEITFETETQVHRVYHEPKGVVAAICPWNYPYMNVAWQCGQALIAGNTIVYKNSEENPLFAKFLEKLINKSAIPEGVFNIIYGDGSVGDFLVHQDIDMISFTGSSKVGQTLTIIAAQKFIPIVTELGGSSPLLIFEDVKITDDLIVDISGKRFKNAGQACDAVKRLIIHKDKFEEVVKKLSAYVSRQKVGDAISEDTDIGPLVAKRQVDLIESQVKDAVDKGAVVVTGGKKPTDLKGAYYLPTVLINVTSKMRVWREETFGPVLPIISFSTEKEAIDLANDTQYGLTAHIVTNDKKRFERVASQIKAGSIGQNEVGFWNPKNPFGGYKKSGMGRLHGPWGFYDFTQLKVISEEK